jgi:hypothetical protein
MGEWIAAIADFVDTENHSIFISASSQIRIWKSQNLMKEMYFAPLKFKKHHFKEEPLWQ